MIPVPPRAALLLWTCPPVPGIQRRRTGLDGNHSPLFARSKSRLSAMAVCIPGHSTAHPESSSTITITTSSQFAPGGLAIRLQISDAQTGTDGLGTGYTAYNAGFLIFCSLHSTTAHATYIQQLLYINSQPPRPHHSRLCLAAVWATFGTRLLSRIACG
ncbi:hypothetical protein GQ607_012678 [Colletotrichum asianum]|uniref:Uncharacterized protein n=1 Tax=Colletotrichum asianum TaxID=702518 RepID=A0A8H3W4W5_9PEZI|nr:hypothetical protein GQ607_012678 [Colletotrichum asianum]